MMTLHASLFEHVDGHIHNRFTTKYVNVLQDRITDHRVHVTFHGWVAMMKGELLDDFQDALKRRDQASNAKAAGM